MEESSGLDSSWKLVRNKEGTRIDFKHKEGLNMIRSECEMPFSVETVL